jgi:uncharacterized phiE125 gp8 family phage protein
MNLRVITPATGEPLVLGEVMAALNIALDDRHQDEWFNRKITAARQAAEEFLNWPLTDAVYEFRTDSFGSAIVLPLGNIGTVSAITYVDTDGAVQTLAPADYVFVDHPREPIIRRAYGVSWPSTRVQQGAVVVTFQGKYSETTSPPVSVPEMVKAAMEVMIAKWDRDREDGGVPQGAYDIMQPLRLGLGV